MAVLLIAGCGGKTDPKHDQTGSAAPVHPDAAPIDAGLAMPKVDTYDGLGAALTATIPAETRVIGFGELHSRTDRAQIKPTLAHFTAEALPVLADKVSDLILETWIVDKGCGSAATEATAKVESTMRRPQETHNDIGDLAEAARKAKIQPHAMRDHRLQVGTPGVAAPALQHRRDSQRCRRRIVDLATGPAAVDAMPAPAQDNLIHHVRCVTIDSPIPAPRIGATPRRSTTSRTTTSSRSI